MGESVSETASLRRIFNSASVDFVFDVGANGGQFRDRLRNDVGYDGPIVSYEPIPSLHSLNLERAKPDPNWVCENFALAETAGRQKFNVMNSTQFSSFSDPLFNKTNIFRKMNSVKEVIEVEVRTLTDEFQRLQDFRAFKTPFLKMDTQGNDIQVLKGGLKILKKLVGYQSELSVTPIYESSIDFRQALYYYEELGFRISSLFLPNKGHFPILVDIDVIMINPVFFNL